MAPKRRPTRKAERRRVALVIESSHSSGRQMLRGIAEYIRQISHWSVYYEASHIQTVLPKWLKNWRGDGIIARIRNRTLARQFAEMRLPVVDLLGDILDTGIPLVQVDNRAISELAASHLIEHGFRSFAFCGVRSPLWSTQRCEVFRKCIADAGYVCHVHHLPSIFSKAWVTEDEERERLTQWVRDLHKPIGIMATNDWAGQKILEACRRIGAIVPEEVAVIGVDNDEAVCEISDPMLSSIIPRHDRVGFHAAELLDQLMQGKSPPSEPLTVGLPSIVVRRSTDVQTIADRDIVEAMRFIREHGCGDIRVEDIAAHVALSYSTLKRRFQRVLCRSIHDEITRVRIARGCELLTETEMTLGQIAQVTGFRHQEYFGVVFKSQMGMTPGQYREKNASKTQ